METTGRFSLGGAYTGKPYITPPPPPFPCPTKAKKELFNPT